MHLWMDIIYSTPASRGQILVDRNLILSKWAYNIDLFPDLIISQTESGRIWFARVVNARRAGACVSEASFYSLAQHFAVALFECHEADDFAPAKSLMNMCFTFYHEGLIT